MTLYAGNSLTSAIYKGDQLICKTGETVDMVAVGKQLRRAEAYEYTEDVSGKYYLVNESYILGPYTQIKTGGSTSGPNAGALIILDGKLYYYDTNKTLIQIGTKTDFKFFKRNIAFDTSGRMYYVTKYNAEQVTNGPINSNEYSTTYLYADSMGSNNPGAIINNGTLYCYNGNNYTAGYSQSTDTGIWTKLFYANYATVWGIRDGLLAYYRPNAATKLIQSEIRPSFATISSDNTGYVVLSDHRTLQYISFAYTTSTINVLRQTTLDYDVVTNSGNYFLCSNGNLYGFGSGNTAGLRATGVSALSKNGGIYIKDNKLYKTNGNSLINIASDLDFSDISKQSLECVFKVSPGTVYRKCYYGTSNMTKVYEYPEQSNPTSFSSKTNTTVTIAGKVYTRNQSRDSSFRFIPDDLRNKAFTDADVLDACLSAGLNLNS